MFPFVVREPSDAMSQGAGARLRLYVHGRLHGLTRQRLEGAVTRAGGRLLRRASPRATLVGLGHGSARVVLAGGPLPALPAALPPCAQVVSEMALRRRLGLAGALPPENRDLSEPDLARAARLDPAVVRSLALYDVIEPMEACYGYRDLVAAREVARLLDGGLGLAAIVEAAVILRRTGRGLFDTRLAETPWGEIVQEVAGRLGRLDGQYALPLGRAGVGADEAFALAEEAELAGDLATAERWYRVAAALDRTDPVIPFNLGNVLDSSGRRNEARLAYGQALGRDPAFAEAWLNLAALHEGGGRVREAVEAYEAALRARPDYPEALSNLAILLTRQEEYAAALLLWERYLALEPRPADAGKARRLALLCRAQARAGLST